MSYNLPDGCTQDALDALLEDRPEREEEGEEMVEIEGQAVDYRTLPACVRGAIERYVEHGIDPGYGIASILNWELDAVLRVDSETQAALPDILRWFYNYAPNDCYGNAKVVQCWMARRRAA